MPVQVYGVNHVVIEVDDAQKAVEFYADVFNLEMLRGGEGAAWCKLGEHQFLAIFEVKTLQPDRTKHFGIMVRDDAQVKEVREKIIKKYGLEVHPDFRCDFRDPWGNRIQVGDLHDESLVWLLPYREVQNSGITFVSPSWPLDHRRYGGQGDFFLLRVIGDTVALWMNRLSLFPETKIRVIKLCWRSPNPSRPIGT